MIISSDGHATARMEDYRPYLPSAIREEFDAFCKVYREVGAHTFDSAAMRARLDPEVVDGWETNIIDTGALEGSWNPSRRIEHQDRDGVSAEVLIPDFGLPFELYSPLTAMTKGYTRTFEQIEAGSRAYNRWLVDFCQTSPDRLGGMATVSFDNVEGAIEEIRWARQAGLKGVMLPMFDEAVPLFDQRYDPIWATLEELNVPANSHVAISGTSSRWPVVSAAAHPAAAVPIYGRIVQFFCHEILSHLIWGGVLERHPNLQVVFTEQGSAWVVGELRTMDWIYEQSYLRRDIRDVVKLKPSEYFARQCHLGSSLLSLAEVEARHVIGVDKMMIGTDYPHHEGTWQLGSVHYLRATLGAAQVTADEAKSMLGGNCARVWGFDMDALRPVADRVGPSLRKILSPPHEDKFPRGDVKKPISAAATF